MMYDIYIGQDSIRKTLDNIRTILDNISTGLGMMIVYISYMSVATGLLLSTVM